MSRLYSLVGADSHTAPGHDRFEPDDAGGFQFPDEVSEPLAGFAVKGKHLWETEEQRAERVHGLELARRRDPASMLAAMEDNAALTRKVTELMAMLTAAQIAQAPPPAEVPALAAPEGDGGPAPKPARTPKAAPARA